MFGMSTGTGLKAEIGDIVMYQNDAQGMVNNMKLLYKADKTGNKNATGTWYTSANPSSNSGSSYRLVAGKVMLNKNGYIQVLPHNAEDTADNYEVHNAGLYSKILVVDNDAPKKVAIAQLTDVYDEICGDDGVNVVVVSAWGGATLMAIYR